jgi:phage/plasmid-associated DNA primase
MRKYFGQGVIELFPYSMQYLKNMVLIATWFNNTILRKPTDVNRQHSVLCLYGTGGSGKSTINNTFK